MFNWFKSKIELKNEKNIMSSIDNKKGVKIGTDIVVPNNFECLIYNNGKHYFTLSAGKHKVEKTDFSQLISAQQKLNKKLKYVKFVSHYISIAHQQLQLKIKKQKYLINFTINNPLKFTEFMLLYAYKVDNDYTITNLSNMFSEIFAYYKYDYKQIPASALEKYGINIDDISLDGKVSIFGVSSTESLFQSRDNLLEKVNSADSVENNMPNDTPTQSQSKNTDINENNNNKTEISTTIQSTNHTPTFPACPKCGHSVKFQTTYCLRCGYKLSEQ